MHDIVVCNTRQQRYFKNMPSKSDDEHLVDQWRKKWRDEDLDLKVPLAMCHSQSSYNGFFTDENVWLWVVGCTAKEEVWWYVHTQPFILLEQT